jgi:hypothetical protein
LTYMLHIHNADDVIVRKVEIDLDTWDMITSPEVAWPIVNFDGKVDDTLFGEFQCVDWSDDEHYVILRPLTTHKITITMASE